MLVGVFCMCCVYVGGCVRACVARARVCVCERDRASVSVRARACVCVRARAFVSAMSV